MGLLPMDADILPPSDDRVFKLILTSPVTKPVLGRRVLPRIARIRPHTKARRHEGRV
jgi:hypothetical protein